MSTIFLTAPNTHDNIANIVMKSSWEAVKTLQLNSHETSLNKKVNPYKAWLNSDKELIYLSTVS